MENVMDFNNNNCSYDADYSANLRFLTKRKARKALLSYGKKNPKVLNTRKRKYRRWQKRDKKEFKVIACDVLAACGLDTTKRSNIKIAKIMSKIMTDVIYRKMPKRISKSGKVIKF